MNGTLAQIVAITIFGNAALTGQSIPAFFPENSTCEFCCEVAFAELGKSLFGKVRESRIAGSPDQWFPYILRKGALGLRLLHKSRKDPTIAEHMLAGFVGGGGTWMIEVVLAKGRSEYWVPEWEVLDENAPDRRIWKVTYGRVRLGPTSNLPVPDLDKVKQRFLESLQAIRSFSVKQKCDPFTACFDRALDTISAQSLKLHGYHKDLSPPGFLHADAIALLDAAQSAHVFGGMGSWNDLIFEKEAQKEYERVSQDLYEALNEAILAATNTSYYQGLTKGSD